MSTRYAQRRTHYGHKGAVLVITLVIMVALAAITTSLLYLISTQLKGAAYDVQSAKAFWVAEAGLEQYLYLLSTEETYRDTYPDLAAPLGDGSFAISGVTRNGDTYTIPSTGTVEAISRTVTRSALVETNGGVTVTLQNDWNET
jgi:Tfp pilus assembly protein PilX